MIRNWEYQKLNMDFSTSFGQDHPSDIDMFYICDDDTLILGEIKNKSGTFTQGQRRLLERVINSHNGDGIGLYIIHDMFYQNGDRTVDVMRCIVGEIYEKRLGRWREPNRVVTVYEVISYYKERAKKGKTV